VENDKKKDLGGSGNVARNITAAGNKCHLISIVGDDNNGKILKYTSLNQVEKLKHTLYFKQNNNLIYFHFILKIYFFILFILIIFYYLRRNVKK